MFPAEGIPQSPFNLIDFKESFTLLPAAGAIHPANFFGTEQMVRNHLLCFVKSGPTVNIFMILAFIYNFCAKMSFDVFVLVGICISRKSKVLLCVKCSAGVCQLS